MRLVSQSGGPFTLRLDQAPSSLEEGLRFQDAEFRPVPVATRSDHKPRRASSETVFITAWMPIARLVYVSQLLIVLLLAIMVFALVFLGARATSNFNHYYWAAEPYMQELRDRGMNMVRNADASGLAMVHLMRAADDTASSAMPGLAKALNESVAAADRLVHLVRNPVVKIALG